jgi:hypothetical protein
MRSKTALRNSIPRLCLTAFALLAMLLLQGLEYVASAAPVTYAFSTGSVAFGGPSADLLNLLPGPYVGSLGLRFL